MFHRKTPMTDVRVDFGWEKFPVLDARMMVEGPSIFFSLGGSKCPYNKFHSPFIVTMG